MTPSHARRPAKAPDCTRLPHWAWILVLPALGACQLQPPSDSSTPGPASTTGPTVLEISPATYQPREGASATAAEAGACRAWTLDRRQAEAFFGLSEQLPEGRLHDFDWLPCTIGGRLQAEGRAWAFEINAAGTSTWRSGDEVRLLGCSRAACAPYVLLMPDIASPD